MPAKWSLGTAFRDEDAFALAYASLFLGPFEILVPPYASMYLAPEQRLMGNVSLEVEQAYADAGLEPGPGPREAPDHVAIELEFMYYLAYQESTTGEATWLYRQRRYWTSHLGCWLPKFAELIADAQSHGFYSRLAELLTVFCMNQARTFSRP